MDRECACGHLESEHAAGYSCLVCECPAFDPDGGDPEWGFGALLGGALVKLF